MSAPSAVDETIIDAEDIDKAVSIAPRYIAFHVSSIIKGAPSSFRTYSMAREIATPVSRSMLIETINKYHEKTGKGVYAIGFKMDGYRYRLYVDMDVPAYLDRDYIPITLWDILGVEYESMSNPDDSGSFIFNHKKLLEAYTTAAAENWRENPPQMEMVITLETLREAGVWNDRFMIPRSIVDVIADHYPEDYSRKMLFIAASLALLWVANHA